MKALRAKLLDVLLAVLAAAAIFMVLLGVVRLFGAPWPTDDTDLSRRVRSGMNPLIDYGTGCHYLSTRAGGLTPRLDPQGRPICVGPLK